MHHYANQDINSMMINIIYFVYIPLRLVHSYDLNQTYLRIDPFTHSEMKSVAIMFQIERETFSIPYFMSSYVFLFKNFPFN